MSTVEKLSIALTPEMAEAVRSAVNAGDYASTSEVIREALRDWRRKRELQAQQIAEVRQQWRAGSDSGEGEFGSMDAIKRAARERLNGPREE